MSYIEGTDILTDIQTNEHRLGADSVKTKYFLWFFLRLGFILPSSSKYYKQGGDTLSGDHVKLPIIWMQLIETCERTNDISEI